jgi:hypothetical protein
MAGVRPVGACVCSDHRAALVLISSAGVATREWSTHLRARPGGPTSKTLPFVCLHGIDKNVGLKPTSKMVDLARGNDSTPSSELNFSRTLFSMRGAAAVSARGAILAVMRGLIMEDLSRRIFIRSISQLGLEILEG